MAPPELDQFAQPEALLTPAEVAALFRVNPKTVTRWARAGKLERHPDPRRASPLPGIRGPAVPGPDVHRARLTTHPASPRHRREPTDRLGRRNRRRLPSPPMGTPTAAYSVAIRVRLDNVPGTLGRLAVAIGDAGGNIVALEGFEAKRDVLDEDLIVNCSRRGPHRRGVCGHRSHRRRRGPLGQRPHVRHARGRQDRGPARMPVRDRDDLSMAYTPGVARVCSADRQARPSGSTSSRSRRTRSPSSPTAPRCSASATSARRPPCR